MHHSPLPWVALGLAVAALPAEAASFACAEARSPDEIAVCSDPTLSALDSEMGGLWFAYRSFPFLMGMSGVRSDDARQFLADRAACDADLTCLHSVYDARIAALQDGIRNAIAGLTSERDAASDAGGDLPAPVEAIVAGYAQQCRELGGTIEPSRPYTLTGDFDGDGRIDYLLDPQNLQCSGAATAFCGNGGCRISILVSGGDYTEPLSVLGGQPTLIQREGSVDVAIWVDGSHCHLSGKEQACWARYSWPEHKPRLVYEVIPNQG